MADTGGRRANEHGDDFRDAIAGLFLNYGFTELERIALDPDERNALSAFEAQRLSTIGQPQRSFVSQLPLLHAHSLHRKLYRVHFLVAHEAWSSPVAFMCRTQGGSGSADEKLEYMYRNMWRLPCRSAAVLGGFERGVMDRAYEVRESSRGKIALVFDSLDSLRRWMTDGFALPTESRQPTLL